MKRLTAEGYQVTVATPVDEYIRYLDQTDFNQHIQLKRLAREGKNPVQDLLLLWELFRLYRRLKPDLVLHFTIKANIYGSLAARLAGVPAVAVVTGLGYTFLHPHGWNYFIPWLYRVAFGRLAKLVTYNPDDQAVFINNNIVEAERCIMMPGSGVPTKRFQPLPKLDEVGRKFIFLFIGRLLWDKGLMEYLHAAREIRKTRTDVECWVVGDYRESNPSGVPKSQLLEWVENQDIRYIGRVMDVRTIIRQADVLVHPSYREGIPRVVIEAMSMAKPVITTNVAGCRETVQHGKNGFIVPPKDAGALALAMETMLDFTPSELEKMGNWSRELACQLFDENIVTSAYLKLFDELFGIKKGEPAKQKGPAIF